MNANATQTNTSSQHPATNLHYGCLDDQPFAGADQHPRTQSTVDLLHLKLSGYAQQPRQNRGALRIGLFGGYGQGKSGVALALQQRLQAEGKSVWRLDFSDYSPQELEYGFDALLAGFAYRIVLLFGLPVVGLIAYSLYQIHNAPQDNPRLIYYLYTLLGSVFGWVVFKPFLLRLRQGVFVAINTLGRGTIAWIFVILGLAGYGLYAKTRDPTDTFYLFCFALAISIIFYFAFKSSLIGKYRQCRYGNLSFLSQFKIQYILFVIRDKPEILWDWFKKLSPRAIRPAYEILILDDLDRATVEQQKSLLRAIYKYSNRMNIAVLVCMDETALLKSAPDPEAPSEFLRKIINFELRLPPHEQGELLLMALEAAQLAHSKHHYEIARYATHPEFLQALVRVLGLLPNSSARRAKRLCNDVLGRAAQLLIGIRAQRETTNVWLYPSDVAALTRLAAIYELLPESRNDPAGLAECLEQNRSEAWQQYCQKLLAAHDENDKTPSAVAPKLEQEVAMNFFAMSRDLQPISSWRALISSGSVLTCNQPDESWASLLDVAQPGECPNQTGCPCWRVYLLKHKTALLEHLRNLRRTFNGIAYGLDDTYLAETVVQLDNIEQEMEKLFPKGKSYHFQPLANKWLRHPGYAWLVFELALSALPQVETRLRLFRYFENLESYATHGLQWNYNDTIKAAFYRAWAADEAAMALLPAADYKNLLDHLLRLPNAFRSVALLPMDNLDWEWRVHATLYPQQDARDVSRVRRWLMHPQNSGMDTIKMPRDCQLQSINATMLTRCWPPLPMSKDLASFAEGLSKEIAKIAEYAKIYDFSVLPAAIKLECWQFGGLERLALTSYDVLSMLHPLLCTDDGKWIDVFWRRFIEGYETEANNFLMAVLLRQQTLGDKVFGLKDGSFESLATLVAISGDSLVLSTFHTSNLDAWNKPITDEECLRKLLESGSFSAFWKMPDFARLDTLLEPDTYKKLDDETMSWQDYLLQIFNKSIRPKDYLQCREYFWRKGGGGDMPPQL